MCHCHSKNRCCHMIGTAALPPVSPMDNDVTATATVVAENDVSSNNTTTATTTITTTNNNINIKSSNIPSVLPSASITSPTTTTTLVNSPTPPHSPTDSINSSKQQQLSASTSAANNKIGSTQVLGVGVGVPAPVGANGAHSGSGLDQSMSNLVLPPTSHPNLRSKPLSTSSFSNNYVCSSNNSKPKTSLFNHVICTPFTSTLSSTFNSFPLNVTSSSTPIQFSPSVTTALGCVTSSTCLNSTTQSRSSYPKVNGTIACTYDRDSHTSYYGPITSRLPNSSITLTSRPDNVMPYNSTPSLTNVVRTSSSLSKPCPIALNTRGRTSSFTVGSIPEKDSITRNIPHSTVGHCATNDASTSHNNVSLTVVRTAKGTNLDEMLKSVELENSARAPTHDVKPNIQKNITIPIVVKSWPKQTTTYDSNVSSSFSQLVSISSEQIDLKPRQHSNSFTANTALQYCTVKPCILAGSKYSSSSSTLPSVTKLPSPKVTSALPSKFNTSILSSFPMSIDSYSKPQGQRPRSGESHLVTRQLTHSLSCNDNNMINSCVPSDTSSIEAITSLATVNNSNLALVADSSNHTVSTNSRRVALTMFPGVTRPVSSTIRPVKCTTPAIDIPPFPSQTFPLSSTNSSAFYHYPDTLVLPTPQLNCSIVPNKIQKTQANSAIKNSLRNSEPTHESIQQRTTEVHICNNNNNNNSNSSKSLHVTSNGNSSHSSNLRNITEALVNADTSKTEKRYVINNKTSSSNNNNNGNNTKNHNSFSNNKSSSNKNLRNINSFSTFKSSSGR